MDELKAFFNVLSEQDNYDNLVKGYKTDTLSYGYLTEPTFDNNAQQVLHISLIKEDLILDIKVNRHLANGNKRSYQINVRINKFNIRLTDYVYSFEALIPFLRKLPSKAEELVEEAEAKAKKKREEYEDFKDYVRKLLKEVY